MANAQASLQPFLAEEAEAHGLAARMPALLIEAQRVAHIGSWTLAWDSDDVAWSDEVYRIFGRDPALGAPTWTGLRRT